MSWIETSTGNRISREAKINNPSNISISENCTISANVTLNGDVKISSKAPAIVIGKYTYLAADCVVEPPRVKWKKSEDTGSVSRLETIIGNYTYIGRNTLVRLIQVGNRVEVGNHCVLGEQSVINDCCIIDDHTVVPAKSVIPPYSRVSGYPGNRYLVEEISPAYRKQIEVNSRLRHVLG